MMKMPLPVTCLISLAGLVFESTFMTQEGVMIIQCENCKTEFNLDESLIKEGGSKVRCSVCKEIFMAYPPTEGATGG